MINNHTTQNDNTVSGVLIGISAAFLTCALMALASDHWLHDWRVLAVFVTLTLLLQIVFIRANSFVKRIVSSVAIVSILLLSSFVVDSFLREWEARTPDLNQIGQLTTWILNGAGFNSSFDDSCIKVAHPEGIVSIRPSADKTGIRWVAVYLWLTFGFASANRVKKTFRWGAIVLLAAAVITVIKFSLIVVCYLEASQILLPTKGGLWLSLLTGYWSHAFLIVFMGIATGICTGSCLQKNTISEPENNLKQKRLTATFAIVAAIAFTITLCHFGQIPGKSKQGRVLFDDTFGGQWEPTARLLDMDWFGDYSTYSFSSPVEWLSKFYRVDVNASKTYTEELLENYDVLILKTPERVIPSKEQQAIENWVKKGGGLLLVGDHTNLLGMGAKLNPLARKAGISFKYDAVSPRAKAGFNNYEPTWSTPHPAANGIKSLLFMTSCSLEISPGVESVLTVSDCVRDPHDYANSSYFGNRRSYPETEYGPAVLCAVGGLGHGKVAAFTDSTVWSSFAFHKFGRSRLFLNLVTQLNRNPSQLYWPIFVGTFLLFVILIIGFKQQWSSNFSSMLAVCLIGIGGGHLASREFNARFHDIPTSLIKQPKAVFLWEGGQCAFPETLGNSGELEAKDMFDTFYVATQRMGIVPRVARKYPEVFAEPSDCVVMIRPIWVPDKVFMDQLVSYVSAGGNLILLEDIEKGSVGSVGPILNAFGIGYEVKQNANASAIVTLNGKPVETSESGIISVGFQKVGTGSVVYIPTATRFSREGMGHCFTIPPEKSKIVYETIDTVFRGLTKVGLPDSQRRTYRILEEH